MQNTESEIKNRINRQNELCYTDTVCEFPKRMVLELTNMCNDSCLFCAHSKHTGKKGIIKPELAERILSEAYSLGTRDVCFHMRGEPLLDRNLERYISFAKNLGYEYTYFTTNGALLTKERAERIVNSGIDSIKFSVNASNSNDYLLMHGKDEFDKVMENIIYLNTLREENRSKFAIYISYVVTRYTESEKDNFERKYKKYVDDILFYDCINQGGSMTNEIAKYLEVDSDCDISAQTISTMGQNICTMIFDRFHVTYEGYLTMCCVDFQNYLVIADLNKESLKDAWNNRYACKLRAKHLQHDLKGTMCHNCWNNCYESVKPLRKEYATEVIMDKWDKSEEIAKRVCEWNTNFK